MSPTFFLWPETDFVVAVVIFELFSVSAAFDHVSSLSVVDFRDLRQLDIDS